MRYNETVKKLGLALSLMMLGLGPGLAAAQQVNITAPAPPKEHGIDGIIGPELPYELTQPDDSRYLPPGPRVHHDPAFIEPLASRYETANGSGWVGLSGWTAPNPPIGTAVSGWRDVSGWFALGFSVTWDGPPAPKSRPR